MNLTYVAAPYNSPEPEVMTHRMENFWKACSKLIVLGESIISPMALEPAVLINKDIPYNWEYWQEYSYKLLSLCSKLIVIQLDGWELSNGVQGEILEATRLGIPIEYMLV